MIEQSYRFRLDNERPLLREVKKRIFYKLTRQGTRQTAIGMILYLPLRIKLDFCSLIRSDAALRF